MMPPYVLASSLLSFNAVISSRGGKEVAFSPYFRGRRYQSGMIGLTDVLFINARRPRGTHQAAAAMSPTGG